MLLTAKKKGVSQNGQIGICSNCVLDRPVFEWCQTLLHPELTLWWSFLLADGAHHKKPHSPTHPNMKDKDPIILYIQYHGCWCPGGSRSQGICSQGFDMIIPK